MAWQTPKTDWQAADGVRDTDFNRIESNIRYLYDTAALQADRVVYVSASEGNDAHGTGAASAPYATIAKALSSIPRNLNGKSALISIDDGTYAESVEINGFSTPIELVGGGNGTIAINSLRVVGCTCTARNMELTSSGSVYVTDGGALIGDITIQLDGSFLTVNYGSAVALDVLRCYNSSGFAVAVDRGSRFYASYIAGSGNASGISCQGGSIAAYGDNELEANSLDVFTALGGRVYSGAQANAPSY